MGGVSVEKFVAFDTETTGLSPVSDRIVELAGVSFRRDGLVIDTFEQLVDPGIPIPTALTGIHGIDDGMVAGKPRIEQVLPVFLRFIGDSVLVAHNAPYDVSMLLVPLVRTKDDSSTAMPAMPGNLVLDTCTLARAVFPGAPNYRLGTIAEMLGIGRGRAHRAMSDVGTCKELFLRILSKCPEGVPLEELIRINGCELHLGLHQKAMTLLGAVGAGAELLAQAMKVATPVLIQYQGGTKGIGPRLVTPITMITQGETPFLIGHCHLDGGLKNFRLDRISAVYPLPAS